MRICVWTIVGALTVLSATACGSGADGAPAVGGGPAADGARGAGGGRRGGQAATIVLAAGDVATVARGVIETTTPLSGDLRPIEEITIRARVEGDLESVLVREGEPVRAGAVLARFDTAEIESALTAAQADAAAARSETATADWNLEQSRELHRAGAISEQALRAAEQTALAARALLAATESRLRTAELARRDAEVIAPATGTISRRLVQTGEHATRGAPMFSLVRDDTLEFTAAVPARSANVLRVGQEVRFRVDDRELVGRVARVSPAIDPASRSIAVYVRVPNRDRSLKANAFASGRVVSAEQRGVLVVPLDAIRRSRQDDAAFAYRIEGEVIGVAPLRLGGTDEARGLVEVVEGLAEGDRVVVGNVGTIGRGMQVQVLDADRRDGAGTGSRGGRGGPR